jgi:hypothetical protein
MAIEVTCLCGTKQHVPNTADGTEVKCIRCGKLVPVTLEPPPVRTLSPEASLVERRLDLENYAITAKFQPEYAGEADHLLKTVAASIGISASAADGMKVRVGWSILTIRQRVQELFLYEPDFSGDVHKETREDLSTTLRVNAAQARLSRMLPGVKLIGCTCFDTIQVPEGVFSHRKLFMRRIKAPIHSESGLYISPTDPLEALKAKEPEETRNRESYLLLKERFAVLQVLGLPPEYVAEFDGNEVVVIYGLKNKVVWKAH